MLLRKIPPVQVQDILLLHARSNYITVYTPDPSVVTFDLFRASSGGSALSGNDLYVVEGQSLYLDNNTTNATQVGSGATYTVDWGDGSADDLSQAILLVVAQAHLQIDCSIPGQMVH